MKLQFLYFVQDLKRMLGKKKYRLLYIWLTRPFLGVFLYRMERGFFLTFGKPYKILRIFFLPLINIIHAFTNIDIHYSSNIEGGLLILHPAIGVVISGKAIIGSNLTLTGGNIIGVNKRTEIGAFVIGKNCELGANAVILGPIKLGDNIKIGALACVTKDCLIPNSILVGVPAEIK